MSDMEDSKSVYHSMHLYEKPFEQIKSGTKTIEVRLNDKKRQLIVPGDIVRFINLETEETLFVKVRQRLEYPTFEELYQNCNAGELGFSGYSLEQMLKETYDIYTVAQEEKYGALGLRIELEKESVTYD